MLKVVFRLKSQQELLPAIIFLFCWVEIPNQCQSMKNMQLLLVLFLMGFASVSFAQTPDSTLVNDTIRARKDKKPDEIVEDFFKTYEINPVKAVGELYAYSPYLDKMEDEVADLKDQIKDLGSILGKLHGEELFLEKDIKDVFVRITYIVKYDRQPIQMHFEFYQPDDQWNLHAFTYDDSFDDELENAMKLEMLNADEEK